METNKPISNLASFSLSLDGLDDNNSPYSFIEWKAKLPLLDISEQSYHYNKYLLQWFKTKSISQDQSKKFFLRQRYLYFLEQLQLFFTSEEKTKWYNYVNLADEKELALAIPYFAKKLKNIAIYYLKLRDKVKNTKLKYNLVGTKAGIEKEVTNLLIETFSTKNIEEIPGIELPNYEDVSKNIQIEVEELYDDHHYLDLSLTKPITAYHDILNEATANFYSSKGISLSADEWIFNSLNIPSQENLTDYSNSITKAILEPSGEEDYARFIETYIGQKKYLMDFVGAYENRVTNQTFDIQIKQGNNFFYYPYGSVDFSVKEPKQMELVPLSSFDILTEQGTAGTSLEDSDTLFVKIGSEMKGAWLRYVETESSSKTLKADIKKDATTSFIFPFPGYGLSSVDVPWTGPGFSSNIEYSFLTKEYKAAVDESYWSQTLPQDTCSSFLINDTNLVVDGATATTNPHKSDQIFVRKTRNLNTSLPREEVEGAWLYKFTQTSIPISPYSTNIIVWPYESYSAASDIPAHMLTIDASQVCQPISINALGKSKFIAGNTFKTADKILRLSNPNDPVESAVEVAWLSGRSYTSVFDTDEAIELYGDNTQYIDLSTTRVSQHGLNALFPPGKAVRFIWGGTRQALNKVFFHTPHAKDCPFISNIPALSSTYHWERCSCKAIYHSPLGHHYETLESGNYAADVIVECTKNELDEFDFGSWTDRFGRSKNESRKFAWFKTRRNKGSYPGRWVSDINTTDGGVLMFAPFDLIPGKMYIYRRAYIEENTPSYSKSYVYESGNTKWMSAKYDPIAQTWMETNVPSQMKLHAGSYFQYQRQTETTGYFLSAVEIENANENRGSKWCSFDYLPLDCMGGQNNTTVISWPLDPKPTDYDLKYPKTEKAVGKDLSGVEKESEKGWTVNDVNNQWPVEKFTDVQIKKWVITRMPDEVSNNQVLTEEIFSTSVTFTPRLTGFYQVQVYYSVTQTEELIDKTEVQTTDSVLTTGGVAQTIEARKIRTFGYESSYPLTVNVHTDAKNSDAFIKSYSDRDTGAITGISRNLVYTTIPMISVVPPTSIIAEPLPVKCPANGFLIEHPLKGWNYNLRSFQRSRNGSEGAKPYWAVVNTQKDINTKYKGLYSWGYTNEYVDGYLPRVNPKVSDMQLTFGDTVEYHRRGYSIVWEQPLTYNQYVGKAQWCKIYNNFNTPSSLGQFYKSKQTPDALAVPLSSPSDILLSNMINGAPVELYYNAIGEFTWTITTTLCADIVPPSPTLLYNSSSPTQNLANAYNATVATLPLLEEIYDSKKYGGYFLPQHLSASVFVNKNFDPKLKTSELSSTYITEDTAITIGGRSVTKQDQSTIYTWEEDNEWIKEPLIMGELAGAPKKSLTKPLQTFVPYYSNDDNDQIGLFKKGVGFSPWGGVNDEEWIDAGNEPKKFTGERDLLTWQNSQVAKKFQNKIIDNLCSDVYGNQYGLFKTDKNGIGELWIRDCSQKIDNALNTASDIFKIAKLTTNEFLSVECFVNVLILTTASKIMFFGIEQDYETNNIIFTTDNYKSLDITSQKRFFQNWISYENRHIITLFFEKQSNNYWSPVLYKITFLKDNLIIDKTFELTSTESTALNQKVYDVLLSYPSELAFTNAVLSYHKQTNMYIIACAGYNESNKFFIMDIEIANSRPNELTSVNLYS